MQIKNLYFLEAYQQKTMSLLVKLAYYMDRGSATHFINIEGVLCMGRSNGNVLGSSTNGCRCNGSNVLGTSTNGSNNCRRCFEECEDALAFVEAVKALVDDFFEDDRDDCHCKKCCCRHHN